MFGETTKKLTCPRPMISSLVDHKRHTQAFHFGSLNAGTGQGAVHSFAKVFDAFRVLRLAFG